MSENETSLLTIHLLSSIFKTREQSVSIIRHLCHCISLSNIFDVVLPQINIVQM